MHINWNPRIKSKKFWLAIVPAFLLVLQTVATPFGYNWDFANIGTQLTAFINAVFGLLSVAGIVIDPTTKGVGDSERVLNPQAEEPIAEPIKEVEPVIEPAAEEPVETTPEPEVVTPTETAPATDPFADSSTTPAIDPTKTGGQENA